jgi:tetratricopeptide (TPR) repeat protein
MNKLKICVYAISLNEEKHVERWVNSMKEADQIYVLDTGSIDKTVEKLKKLGVKVKQKIIKPWRFDKARNESLKLLPKDTDICVCTDLDEVFIPGWRKELEKIWTPNTQRIRYNYNWKLDKNNKPIINYYIDKIHTRNNYKWTHPVHEVLTYTKKDKEIIKTADKITLNHYPDQNKSRNSYLKLLELSVKEDPEDDRNMHYLGREYMYYQKWNKCIDTLIKHLKLKKSTWKDERSASMRFIARSYINLRRYEEAKIWLNKAIEEAPYLRDPYVEMALLEYYNNNYKEVIKYCNLALKIKERKKTYINEIFSWDETIYDLLSISYFYNKNIEESLKNIELALKINPENKRIINNKKIIKEYLKNSSHNK